MGVGKVNTCTSYKGFSDKWKMFEYHSDHWISREGMNCSGAD